MNMISNKTNRHQINEILENFAQTGINQLKDSLEKLFNELMLAEREEFINASPYERTDNRKDYSNGFKDKKLLTRTGELNLRVPQVRSSDFYPSCLEKGEKVEQAFKLVLAEAYVQGVSTRKIKRLTEELCGKEVSSTQVSRFAAVLDEEIYKFKERPLGSFEYVYFDAQYEKIRYEGAVRSLAIFKAVGVNSDGIREVLGISCALSEAEVHWRYFMESLLKRGLHGVKLVISDSHRGLKNALNAVFPSVAWQRCLFHLAQNAASQAPSVAMRAELCSAVKELYTAQDRSEAETRMKKVINRYENKAHNFCDWLEQNFIEGLTFFEFPKSHWQKIRTSNVVERINREQKRRTRVAGLFQSISSCNSLVGAIAMQINEEWAVNGKYLTKN